MVAATHRLTPTTHTTHVRCRIRYVNCYLTKPKYHQISSNVLQSFIIHLTHVNVQESNWCSQVLRVHPGDVHRTLQEFCDVIPLLAAEELIVCELNSFEHGAHTVLSLLEISFPVTLLFHAPAHQYNWHTVMSVQYHMIIKLVHSVPPKGWS